MSATTFGFPFQSWRDSCLYLMDFNTPVGPLTDKPKSFYNLLHICFPSVLLLLSDRGAVLEIQLCSRTWPDRDTTEMRMMMMMMPGAPRLQVIAQIWCKVVQAERSGCAGHGRSRSGMKDPTEINFSGAAIGSEKFLLWGRVVCVLHHAIWIIWGI